MFSGSQNIGRVMCESLQHDINPFLMLCSLGALSEILDKSNDTPTVDLSELRKLCAYGIDYSPPFFPLLNRQ